MRCFPGMAFSVVLLASMAAGQTTTPDVTDLAVNVSFAPAPPPEDIFLRVTLMDALGLPLAEVVITPRNRAEFGSLRPGNYRVRVEGDQIEEATVEFAIQRREGLHMEVVQVLLKPAPPGVPAAQGVVSSLDLAAPDNAKQEFRKGTEALHKREWKQARKRLERALALYSNFPSAHNNLGMALLELGEVQAAHAAFQRAIQLDGRMARPYFNLGRSIFRHDNPEEAETLLLKAAALEPTNAEVLTLLANVQLRIGKLEEARTNAAKVHTLPHGRWAFAHFIAALALEHQGQPQQAAAEYELYLQESPSGPNVKPAREALSRLRKGP